MLHMHARTFLAFNKPTAPPGPPNSAFCKEIIPHCLPLYPPKLSSSIFLPPPPSPCEFLTQRQQRWSSQTGSYAAKLSCPSAEAQPAEQTAILCHAAGSSALILRSRDEQRASVGCETGESLWLVVKMILQTGAGVRK